MEVRLFRLLLLFTPPTLHATTALLSHPPPFLHGCSATTLTTPWAGPANAEVWTCHWPVELVGVLSQVSPTRHVMRHLD